MKTLEEVYKMIYKSFRENYIAEYRDAPNNLARVDRLSNIGAVKNTVRVWKEQWL